MLQYLVTLEKDMFEIFILIISLCCIGIMVYSSAASDKLPPKAKLVCDIWELVENKVDDFTENRVVSY